MNNPHNFCDTCDDESEGYEGESFVPNSQLDVQKTHENVIKKGVQSDAEEEMNEVEDGGEDDEVEAGHECVDVESSMGNDGYTYESPLQLYGPNFYRTRMWRRKGRHVRPDFPCMGSVMTRNDQLPVYFDDVKHLVVPDTYDGYEGLDLKDLEDDADSIRGKDPFARKNMTVDLFTPSRGP